MQANTQFDNKITQIKNSFIYCQLSSFYIPEE